MTHLQPSETAQRALYWFDWQFGLGCLSYNDIISSFVLISFLLHTHWPLVLLNFGCIFTTKLLYLFKEILSAQNVSIIIFVFLGIYLFLNQEIGFQHFLQPITRKSPMIIRECNSDLNIYGNTSVLVWLCLPIKILGGGAAPKAMPAHTCSGLAAKHIAKGPSLLWPSTLESLTWETYSTQCLLVFWQRVTFIISCDAFDLVCFDFGVMVELLFKW